MRWKTIHLPLTLLFLSLGARAYAQTSGAAFLEIDPSARSYSLGMADTVSALGAQAFGANPANIGLLAHRFEVFTSYASLLDGAKYEHFAAAMEVSQVPVLDSVGLAVTSLQNDGFTATDSLGNQTGTLSAGDLAVALGGSGTVGEHLRLGAAVKMIQSQIASYKSGTSLGGDVGATYTLSPFDRPLSVGFSLTNFGQGIKFISQTDPLPTSVNLGAAWPLGRVLVVAEVNRLIHDQATEAGAGAELNMGPVSFRGGWTFQDNSSANLALQDQSVAGKLLGGLTGGVGLRVAGCALDYAISQQAVDYGPTQRVSLSIAFGESSRRSPSRRGSARLEANSNRSDWLLSPLGNY